MVTAISQGLEDWLVNIFQKLTEPLLDDKDIAVNKTEKSPPSGAYILVVDLIFVEQILNPQDCNQSIKINILSHKLIIRHVNETLIILVPWVTNEHKLGGLK